MKITELNAVIELNKNPQGVTMVRKNFKNRSVVKVLGKNNYRITEYRFNNIDLKYKTKFMNWQNLDCCGGWAYSELDLVKQFKNGNKLFAEVIINPDISKDVFEEIEKCKELDNVEVHIFPHWLSSDHKSFFLIKKGALDHYIDVDKILEDYRSLGLWFISEDQVFTLKCMASEDMNTYISKEHNKFCYDFGNPVGMVELIFTGMLLGYPIESTADILGL